MIINIEIFFYILLASVFSILGTSIVIFHFAKWIKKNSAFDRSHQHLAKSSQTEDKAVKIIDDANSKALDIIKNANFFVDNSKNEFDKELRDISSDRVKAFEKTTSEFLEFYENTLKDLQSKNIEIFQNISKDIEESANSEIKNFKSAIEKQTIQAESLAEKKINEQHLLAQKDIDTYKQNEIAKINQNIYKLLERVSNLVIGDSLSLSEHEKLIQDALTKAKKEGLFN
jgi:F0F1-type ATP synthase membrane subunit b/b'